MASPGFSLKRIPGNVRVSLHSPSLELRNGVTGKLCVFQNLICWLLPTSPLSHLDDVNSSGWPTRTQPALSPGAILGHMSLPRDLAAKGTSREVTEGTPSPWVLSAADLLSQL